MTDFLALARRSYWTRRWTLQEFASDGLGRVYCGDVRAVRSPDLIYVLPLAMCVDFHVIIAAHELLDAYINATLIGPAGEDRGRKFYREDWFERLPADEVHRATRRWNL